jgi:cobalt-precorrin 5A hydrolase
LSDWPGVETPRRPALALGLGCDRGTPAATIAQAVDEALLACGGQLADVQAVASIDLKADEVGPAAGGQRSAAWRVHFYPAADLAAVDVPNPSETVRRHTGSPLGLRSGSAACSPVAPTRPI